MPEALEKWPLSLFGRLLPRHLEIVFEINQRFLGEVRAIFPRDEARVRRMSLIEESPEKQVRMANLACVSCFSVNGVSKLRSGLLASPLEEVVTRRKALDPHLFELSRLLAR